MKRSVFTTLFLFAIAVLPGCPIYNHDDDDCESSEDCAPGFSCDDHSGNCFQQTPRSSCHEPGDCSVNETCSVSGQCVTGDCSFSGCVRGYVCDSSSERWECVRAGAPSGASDGGAGGESSISAVAGAAGAT